MLMYQYLKEILENYLIMFVIKLLVSSDEKIKLEKNAEIKVIHKNCDAEICIYHKQSISFL